MPPPARHDRTTRLSDNLEAHMLLAERAVVVRLDGELELTSVGFLRRELLGLADDGHVRQVLDLTGVIFVDSAGLGLLVSMHRRLRARRGALALVCDKDSILRLLRITSLDKVLHVHGDVEDAISAEFPA